MSKEAKKNLGSGLMIIGLFTIFSTGAIAVADFPNKIFLYISALIMILCWSLGIYFRIYAHK
jgi:hypothetical protein